MTTQNGKGFYSLIQSESYDPKKTDLKIIKKESFISIIPHYEYIDEIYSPLIIQTPFLDVNNYIKYKNINSKSKSFSINFDQQFFDSNLQQIFASYDNYVSLRLEDTYKRQLKCVKKLENQISGKIVNNKFLGDYSKLINYNISKKYEPKEEFDFAIVKKNEYEKIFDRILNNKKQIRLILAPMSWVNEKEMIYGSYLNIFTIEVKYKFWKVNSVLDQNETSVKRTVKKINI